MPRSALASWPVMSHEMVVGELSFSCSKVTVPLTLESPRRTATRQLCQRCDPPCSKLCSPFGSTLEGMTRRVHGSGSSWPSRSPVAGRPLDQRADACSELRNTRRTGLTRYQHGPHGCLLARLRHCHCSSNRLDGVARIQNLLNLARRAREAAPLHQWLARGQILEGN